MRVALLFSAFFFLLQARSQDNWRMDLIASAKGLPAARTDAERDSLDLRIKAGLKRLFDTPDLFTADLKDIPLSRVDAPDGTFRLFTWNLPNAVGGHRYEGLLMVQLGKKRSLHELRDLTAELNAPEIPELGPERWYGALYYQVVPVKKGGKTYYTLLGWKGYSKVETRKVVEVLSFKGGKPRFGAPLFGAGKLKKHRLVFGYSFQASMALRYEAAQERIVLDHLVPARADQEGQWAFYGPDMSYDAYVWDKGQWQYVRDIDARDDQRNGKPFKAPPKAPTP
jgi:hypothetical protein